MKKSAVWQINNINQLQRNFPIIEPLEKNTKSRSRSHFRKKSGAGAGPAWKKSQEPDPEPLKNLPAP